MSSRSEIYASAQSLMHLAVTDIYVAREHWSDSSNDEGDHSEWEGWVTLGPGDVDDSQDNCGHEDDEYRQAGVLLSEESDSSLNKKILVLNSKTMFTCSRELTSKMLTSETYWLTISMRSLQPAASHGMSSKSGSALSSSLSFGLMLSASSWT